MHYLKYYFGYNDSLFFDSIACEKGKEPEKPPHFLKWYEEGDFAPISYTKEEKKSFLKKDSPVFNAIFHPRKVTFSLDNLLKSRASE